MSERPQMDEFTFGSLFAGIGGFDLGFERIGMCCAWQTEIDDRCNEVLAYHWPETQRLKDVKDVGRHNLETVDLVCGGFPCQDVSVAGRREGLDGERSGLWFEFIRIVEELGPKWVVVENVPGLLSSNDKRDFAAVLSGLGQRGYWWAYRVLDAQFFGVPQRRRRVFVVGCLAKGRAQEVLFERESSPWDTSPGREERAQVADPITKSFAKHRGASAGKDSYPRNMIVRHALSGHNQRNDPDGEHFVITRPLAHGQTTNHYDESQQTYVVFDTTQVTSRENRSNPQSGNPCHPLAAEAHAPAIAFAWQQGVSPNDRSYPVRAGDYAGSLSSTRHDAVFDRRVGVRRLTPTECERLQGFPDDWTAINGMKDGPRYRMLGNAVCVPVAAWIGKRIMATEEVMKHGPEFGRSNHF